MNAAARAARSGPGPGYYSAGLLETFAGGAHAEYLAGRRPLRPRLARSLALAGLAPGLRVVDLGSGRGEAAAQAARRGARVTAVDFSLGGLALAGDTAVRRAGAGRVIRLAADAAALPLADASADRVLCLDLVEHLPPAALARALAECRRILRPGGYVVIHTLPNRWALEGSYRLLRLLAPDLPAEPRSAYERAVHVNEQDPLRLARALAAAGLASRVWVEEWSTRQAAWGRGLTYPDAARRLGYTVLARPAARSLGRWMMATPARWLAANDIFALAWRPDSPAPPATGRWRPVR